jgi:hypothetical protein
MILTSTFYGTTGSIFPCGHVAPRLLPFAGVLGARKPLWRSPLCIN